MKKIIIVALGAILFAYCNKESRTLVPSNPCGRANVEYSSCLTNAIDSLNHAMTFQFHSANPTMDSMPLNQKFEGNTGPHYIHLITCPRLGPYGTTLARTPAQAAAYVQLLGYTPAPPGYLFGIVQQYDSLFTRAPRNLACVNTTNLKTVNNGIELPISIMCLSTQTSNGAPVLVAAGYDTFPVESFYEIICFKN